MKKHLFCFGLGYTALEIINSLYKNDLARKWKFSGTKQTLISHNFVEIYKFNELDFLPQDITHLLISIPPNENGDIVYNKFGTLIKKLPLLEWIGYFSTTGVYGDYKGEWVDEASETKASQPRSIWRLNAEKNWLTFKEVAPMNIFRLGAIYGPYRNEIEKVLSGKARIIIKPNQFFSRIHVSDIAQIVTRCMLKLGKSEIYNLVDDFPSSQQEVVEYACNILNVSPPKPIYFEDISDNLNMLRSFYSESRKVSNQKAKELLRINLRYPSYKEGLNAIFQTVQKPLS